MIGVPRDIASRRTGIGDHRRLAARSGSERFYVTMQPRSGSTALKLDAHLPPSRLRRKRFLSTALLIIVEMGFEPMDRKA